MPCDTTWLIENRLIYQCYYGTTTVDEATATYRFTQSLFDAGQPPIHNIVVIERSAATPNSLVQLSKSTPRVTHPHAGWVILVNKGNPLISFFITTLIQFVGVKKFEVFGDIKQAVEFLNQADPSLNLEVSATEAFIAARPR